MPHPMEYLAATVDPSSSPEALTGLSSWAVDDMRARLQYARDAGGPDSPRGAEPPTGRWARIVRRFGPLSPALAAAEEQARQMSPVLREATEVYLRSRTTSACILADGLPQVRDEASRGRLQAAVLTSLLAPSLLGDQAARRGMKKAGFSMPDLTQHYYGVYAGLRRGSNISDTEVRARAAGQVVREVLTGHTSAGGAPVAAAALRSPAPRDRGAVQRQGPVRA